MLNLFKSRTSSSVTVVRELLRTLQVNANTSSIKLYLVSHPDSPSLLSISDYLSSIKVKNQVHQLQPTEDNLRNLPLPFITSSTLNGGEFILVRELNNDQATFIDGRNIVQQNSVPDFLKLWDGVFLFAQGDKYSGEKNYQQNRLHAILSQFKLPVFMIALLMALFLIADSDSLHGAVLGLVMIKFAGLIVTFFLLSFHLNFKNSLVKKLCSFTSENDCANILNSDAAKITSWLSWSEIGFFYFCGSFLFLISFPSLIPILQLMNILALPFIIYSSTYQYKIKSWCTFCISIQFLLIIESLLFNISYPIPMELQLKSYDIIHFFTCMLLLPSTWYIIKPTLQKAVLNKSLQYELYKFKYDSGVFNSILKSQTFYAIQKDLKPITLGNTAEDVEYTITLISNPFCQPCEEAHHFLEKWLQQREDLQLNIIFAHSNQDSDIKTMFARQMTAFSVFKDKYYFSAAMYDWYNNGKNDYKQWLARHPANHSPEVIETCSKQKKWCDESGFIFTPIILINGYMLPEPYQLEDLQYLLN